jgi:ABC-type phosphate transport system auxiliary subunit
MGLTSSKNNTTSSDDGELQERIRILEEENRSLHNELKRRRSEIEVDDDDEDINEEEEISPKRPKIEKIVLTFSGYVI